jgi:hypothetical protein
MAMAGTCRATFHARKRLVRDGSDACAKCLTDDYCRAIDTCQNPATRLNLLWASQSIFAVFEPLRFTQQLERGLERCLAASSEAAKGAGIGSVVGGAGGLGTTAFHGRQKIKLSSGLEMLIRTAE